MPLIENQAYSSKKNKGSYAPVFRMIHLMGLNMRNETSHIRRIILKRAIEDCLNQSKIGGVLEHEVFPKGNNFQLLKRRRELVTHRVTQFKHSHKRMKRETGADSQRSCSHQNRLNKHHTENRQISSQNYPLGRRFTTYINVR